jgi:curli biogenesis system outer membrane secretion channel CsgG
MIRSFAQGLSSIAALMLLTGCATTLKNETIAPLRGAPIESVETDYSSALRCLSAYAREQSFAPPRVAIGYITDLTGAQDSNFGRRFTQGATLMAMSAASEAGMRLVERFDMGVAQVELDYANRRLVRDAPSRLRQTSDGQIEGADLYIVGGITEFNPNIRSSGGNFYIGGESASNGALSIKGNDYVFDVALDLRMVDARSTEVIAIRSLRKQVRGYEIEGGLFGFIPSKIADVGGGTKALEPTQSAIRGMIDRAVFEFMAQLYGLADGACLNGAPARAISSPPRLEPDKDPAPKVASPPADGDRPEAPGGLPQVGAGPGGAPTPTLKGPQDDASDASAAERDELLEEIKRRIAREGA